MVKIMALGAMLALGLATATKAAPLLVPAGAVGSAVMQVGEGCGAWRWRGPGGACNPFYGPGGSNRGTVYECPPGFHIGPGGGRCWPNRPY